jgi:predicted alpha/beta-hydrolase family hydrolase
VGAADDALPALGLALISYPLHPPGRPDQLRVEHLPRLGVPVLFVSGTRDPFGTPDELQEHAQRVTGPVTFSWVETGDHSLRPLKSSGRTAPEVLESVAATVVDWVRALA